VTTLADPQPAVEPLNRETRAPSGAGRARKIKRAAGRAARALLPSPLYRWVHGKFAAGFIPPVGAIRFGDLRRTSPISRCYGYDRGRPIDRYYIENFLESRSNLITGCVLEIGERTYTQAFGKGVDQSDMLHVNDVEGATYVDDLAEGLTIPSNTYDCVILTQTLHLIFDMKAALRTIYRILKPGGVLLCTVPGITQAADEDWNETWYWALTSNSARRLTEQVFPPGNVEISHWGNVLSATCFLQGLAESELTRAELDCVDPEYQVTIAITARCGDAGMHVPMEDRWDYRDRPSFPYDDETSYRLGMEFLDGHGDIEDWGCGTAYAKRFVIRSEYTGVDGSESEYAAVKADLQVYRSDADCVFMRHVLEHNWGWRTILANALASFRKRMVLILFTPLGESELRLDAEGAVPDLQLSRDELASFLQGFVVREEQIRSATQYGMETIFYLEK
jgi:SAM-dependent methyltransferase